MLVKRDIFRRSPHNSLDSSDSGKSVKLAEDSDGFTLARASDHCKTFWLSKRNKLFERSVPKMKSYTNVERKVMKGTTKSETEYPKNGHFKSSSAP